ncbi:hypothetical protein K3495_g13916 [Podosphaera aphanis]|nr:hypothetical protein K3495_g13916 [Podosphaera aphanis]
MNTQNGQIPESGCLACSEQWNIWNTKREATRSERVRPDNRITPPLEGIGSSEMPIVFSTDPVDASLIQSARRNGIPPPRKRTRLMKPIPPPGTRPCNCNK